MRDSSKHSKGSEENSKSSLSAGSSSNRYWVRRMTQDETQLSILILLCSFIKGIIKWTIVI